MPLPKKFYQALSLVVMGLVLLGCSVEANTPEATVKKLADWYLKNGFKEGYSALLKVEDAKPLFDPAVIRLLAEAKVERDRQIKAHPGDKPAFVDNTLITGFQDRVDQYRILETRQWGRSPIQNWPGPRWATRPSMTPKCCCARRRKAGASPISSTMKITRPTG